MGIENAEAILDTDDSGHLADGPIDTSEPEQEHGISHTHKDGTTEYAKDMDEAVVRCPMLGKMAAGGNIEQANLILEMAAAGKKRMAEEAQASEDAQQNRSTELPTETSTQVVTEPSTDRDITVAPAQTADQSPAHEMPKKTNDATHPAAPAIATASPKEVPVKAGPAATEPDSTDTVVVARANSEKNTQPVKKKQISVEAPAPTANVQPSPKKKLAPIANETVMPDSPEKTISDEVQIAEIIELDFAETKTPESAEIAPSDPILHVYTEDSPDESETSEGQEDATPKDAEEDFRELPTEHKLVQLINSLQEPAEVSDEPQQEQLHKIIHEIEETLPAQNRSTSSAETQLPPELREKLVKLMDKLGYKDPDDALTQLLREHGVTYLIKMLEYMCQLNNDENNQEFLIASTITANGQDHVSARVGRLLLSIIMKLSPEPVTG